MVHLGGSLAGVWQVRLLATSEAAGRGAQQRPGSNTHISQGGPYLLCISTVSTLYLFCCTSTISSSHIYFVYLPYLPHLLCISTVTLYIYYLPYLCLLSTAGWAIQNPGGGCVGPSQPALAQLQAGILILDGMDTLRLSI